MEHFIEAVLELLFGLAKDKPDKMPEMEYVDHFTIQHPFKKTLARIFASLVIIVIFSLLWILVHRETVFVVFVGFGILLIILSSISFSFRCFVNENCLHRSYFGIFKKEITWKSIICVRTIEQKNEKAVIIALYDHEGKCVMDFNTDMINAWCIIKMAEHKGIEIRKEKDLPLKKISKLSCRLLLFAEKKRRFGNLRGAYYGFQ